MPIDPAKPFDLEFVPDASETGRLDHFIKGRITSMSRTRVQQRIREGRVSVNGAVRKANWIVRPGDRVLVRCPAPDDAEAAARAIPLDFLYEDEHVAAFNKPAGVVVHPVGRHRHDTLLNALYLHYRDRLPADREVSLVNRLDQHTSGVILVALHADAKRVLQDAFEAREPEKEYRALCLGWPDPEAGAIDLPLGPDPDADDHCQQAVLADGVGKPATTRYETLERFTLAPVTHPAATQGIGDRVAGETRVAWMRLRPVTGRQHQLRVHMAAIGHPLVGDDRYGDGKALAGWPADGEPEAVVDRYALHAAETACRHPVTGAPWRVEAPAPADLARALDLMRRRIPLCFLRL